jgi:hypothetical protein
MPSSPSISPPVEPDTASAEPLPVAPRKFPIGRRGLLRGLLLIVCAVGAAVALTNDSAPTADALGGLDPSTTLVLAVAEGDRYGEARLHVGGADRPALADDAEIREALVSELAGDRVRTVALSVAPGVYQREVVRARRLLDDALAGRSIEVVLIPLAPAPASP